jgi:hypothetical protein
LQIIFCFEIACIVLLRILFNNERLGYFLFFVGLWLVCNATLSFETFVLHWQANETRGIYLTSVILNLLFVGMFWKLFKPKNE